MPAHDLSGAATVPPRAAPTRPLHAIHAEHPGVTLTLHPRGGYHAHATSAGELHSFHKAATDAGHTLGSIQAVAGRYRVRVGGPARESVQEAHLYIPKTGHEGFLPVAHQAIIDRHGGQMSGTVEHHGVAHHAVRFANRSAAMNAMNALKAAHSRDATLHESAGYFRSTGGRFSSLNSQAGATFTPVVPRAFRERMEALGAKVRLSGSGGGLVLAFESQEKAAAAQVTLVKEGVRVVPDGRPGILYIQSLIEGLHVHVKSAGMDDFTTDKVAAKFKGQYIRRDNGMRVYRFKHPDHAADFHCEVHKYGHEATIHERVTKRIAEQGDMTGGITPDQTSTADKSQNGPEHPCPCGKEHHESGVLKPARPESEFDAEALKAGTSHELEHTKDRETASVIARHHLAERPDYYAKLDAAGLGEGAVNESHWVMVPHASKYMNGGPVTKQHLKSLNAGMGRRAGTVHDKDFAKNGGEKHHGVHFDYEKHAQMYAHTLHTHGIEGAKVVSSHVKESTGVAENFNEVYRDEEKAEAAAGAAALERHVEMSVIRCGDGTFLVAPTNEAEERTEQNDKYEISAVFAADGKQLYDDDLDEAVRARHSTIGKIQAKLKQNRPMNGRRLRVAMAGKKWRMRNRGKYNLQARTSVDRTPIKVNTPGTVAQA